MKGSITLNVKGTGEISGVVNMVGVGTMDKVVLLHAFCSALNIENDELLAMMLTRQMFDEGSEKTVIDMRAMKKDEADD